MPKYFSLDVQFVATGFSCSSKDRAIGSITLVDSTGDIAYFAIIQQSKKIINYFESQTGLSTPYTRYGGVSLEEAIKKVKERLGPDSVLVAHNCKKFIKSLGLERGNLYF